MIFLILLSFLSRSLTSSAKKNHSRIHRLPKDIRKDCKQIQANPSTLNLLNFTQWQREEGFWWGEYTFLNGDGNPYTSTSWPYPYDHYYGAIRMKIEGNKLHQRNIFIYPPASSQFCLLNYNITAKNATGLCGIHGQEKIFQADQTAVDCNGNLAGPYGSGSSLSNTYTTLVGSNAILYEVFTPDYAAMGNPTYAPYSNKLIQSQLTTLPGTGVRVRSAQGFNLITGLPNSMSFFREYRLKSEVEWIAKLNQLRAVANIIPSDMCAYDSNSNRISRPDCYEHIVMGDKYLNISCHEINGGDPWNRCTQLS